LGEVSDLERRTQLRIGAVLKGKYTIDRILGIGGMAVVYVATHRNQKQFAVKLLHPELSVMGDLRARFLREGYAANSVKHPGAVAVLDDDIAEDGSAFLVMELLEGESVEHMLERGPLALPAVLAIGHQLLDVLAAGHAKGIVHRDIKPANLFVLRDGSLKVLDFGIARIRDAATTGGSGHSTGTGMLLGTPAFMAPEQALAKASEIDGQTDVWAVGATLFTLLTGVAVHQGDNPAQLMVQSATVQARSVGTMVPGLPGPIASVIDGALAYHKASRWPTAGAMRDAIEQASVQALGRPPGKEALATLVQPDVSMARTEPPPPGVTPAPGPGGLVIATPPPMSAPHPTARMPGATTARAVSTSNTVPGARRGRAALGGMVGAAAVVMLVAGGLAMRGRFGNTQAAAVLVPSALPDIAAAPPVQSAPAPTTIASPALTSEPAPTSRPALAAVTPKSTGTKATAAASTASLPAAAASAPRPKPACDPPYVFDADGNKHFKPECFQH
jgi:serine/threonine-protein kinase